MKVLHLWKSNVARAGGGGAVAMSRLHAGLQAAGIDSKVLCEIKTNNSIDIIKTNAPNRWEKRIRLATSRLGLNDIHRISSFRLNQHPVYQDADVITIHGTHHGFINYLALPRLTRNKPTAFVLHDMWALTGHCAVSFGCERWVHGCGKCPHLDAPPVVQRDSTWLEWKLKNWAYSRSRLTIISPSNVLTEQAKQSMLSRFNVFHVPHGLDTAVFRPIDTLKARSLLGIPPNKKVLMFTSVDINSFGKGVDLLFTALKNLPNSLKDELILMTLGQVSNELSMITDVPTHNLGYIEDDQLKVQAYSAADLFVSPTRGEAFGLSILESIACGTPVVAFGVGGVLDLVRPGITGYVAKPENAEDLCRGIVQLLVNEDLRRSMSETGLKVVQQEYTLDLQVKRYIDLYQEMLTN